MIDFTRAFDSAWERMMVILFRPFDFGKWLVIGLSAFLAGLLQGGNGFGGTSFNNFGNLGNQQSSQATELNWNKLHSELSNALVGVQLGLIIAIVIMVMLVGFALALVFYWLGARGQFLLLDNIVRNRAAVSWPWQYYARQANSLFGMYLLFILVSLLLLLPLIGVAVVMCIPLFQHHRGPETGEIIGFVVLGCLYMLFALLIGVTVFLFREFGVPLMFRNGLMARPAFFETLKLVRQHPGSILVFVLLRIALAVAVIIVSAMTCCCCVGFFPYVGTVAILPALIYVRCFTLDCLAQFGPEYDVWTVDVPPAGSAVNPPLPPG